MIQALPLIKQEQYIDFFKARRFRTTLLCHDDIPLNRNITADTLTQFHLALAQKPQVVSGDSSDEAPLELETSSATLRCTHPLSKAAMLHLMQQQHRYISCEDLRTSALARLGLSEDDSVVNDPQMSIHALVEQLLPAFSVGLLMISLHPATAGAEPGQRPKVQPLTRWQAARSDCVTNRYHENV
ncbi:hypothetical protein LCGC14_2191720, partial [marine sediment metagenome]